MEKTYKNCNTNIQPFSHFANSLEHVVTVYVGMLKEEKSSHVYDKQLAELKYNVGWFVVVECGMCAQLVVRINTSISYMGIFNFNTHFLQDMKHIVKT